MYSANRFFIHYTHPGSLGPLRSLTPASLASLTHLKIVLNQASRHHPDEFSCYVGFCCLHGRPDKYHYGGVRVCNNEHHGLHRPPLLSSDDDGLARLRVQGMLNEWHSTAAYLSTHTTLRLELSPRLRPGPPERPCARCSRFRHRPALRSLPAAQEPSRPPRQKAGFSAPGGGSGCRHAGTRHSRSVLEAVVNTSSNVVDGPTARAPPPKP